LVNITSQTDSNHLQNVNVTTVYKRLEYLETEMKNVPTNANLESITSSLVEKAKQSDLNTTNANVALKADKTTTNNLQSQISGLASGAPKPVTLVSQMTDTTKIYVYTGNEAGYTAGNWYYWNGTAWTSGGIYQSAGISNKAIFQRNTSSVFQEKFLIGYEFEIGARNAETDAKIITNTRIVMLDKVSLKAGTKISLYDNVNYSYILQKYNADGSIIVHYPTWQTGETTITDGTLLYRLTMKKNDGSAFMNLIDQTTSNLIIYSGNSIFSSVDSLVNSKPLTLADISGEVDLSKLTFSGNKTVTSTDMTLQNLTDVTTDNDAKLYLSLPREVFVEIEFEARASEVNVAHVKFGFSYNGAIKIDTADYKPYKIREYNKNVNANAYIQFLTTGTCKLDVRNVNIRYFGTLPRDGFNSLRFTAHRGISDHAPENTMPAFALARIWGMTTIECDIQQTSDGVWVICHDATIDRTSDGTGAVESMTYAQLLQYDFRSWFGTEFANTRIPTLEQVLQFGKSSGLHVYLEFKGSGVTVDKATSVINLIKKYGMMDNVSIEGYYPDFQIISSIDTEKRLRLAQSGGITQSDIDNLKALGHKCCFHTATTNLTNPANVILLANNNGVEVEIWTVDDFNTIRDLVKMGVSGITTNHVNLNGCYY
jgi:glycerophosphoryl diester phosphodiesterase